MDTIIDNIELSRATNELHYELHRGAKLFPRKRNPKINRRGDIEPDRSLKIIKYYM